MTALKNMFLVMELAMINVVGRGGEDEDWACVDGRCQTVDGHCHPQGNRGEETETASVSKGNFFRVAHNEENHLNV